MGKKDAPPVPEPKNKLFFTFGPEDSTFFSSPRYRRWSENAPEDFKKTVPDGDPNKPEPEEAPPPESKFSFNSMKRAISHHKDDPVEPQPYHVSFGDKGSWVAVWDNGEHDERLEGVYPSLLQWLRENQATTTDGSLNVSLGPNGAFFAWSTGSCRWANVPAAFQTDIQNMLCHDGWKRRPKGVTFGINESYVIVCDDGSWCPNGLEENYPGLTELLTHSGKMKSLSLNAYGADNYFLVAENGDVHWKVPQTWNALVDDASGQYMIHNKVRSPSLPLEGELVATKKKKKVELGTMTTTLAYTNTALQVGQLVCTADPSQCQHQ